MLLVLPITGVWAFKNVDTNPKYTIGQAIDELNGVSVYYNGGVSNVVERNTTTDGYNLGLKYQCVEFVKRYYYQQLNHKMPDSYGHAKDFFDKRLKDGKINTRRNLLQYKNAGKTSPQIGDLVVFDGHPLNRYGHVAIIAKVTDKNIEIIQQNAGPFASTRTTYSLSHKNSVWTVEQPRLLGWLRKQ